MGLGSPYVLLGLLALVTALLGISGMEALCQWMRRQLERKRFSPGKPHIPSQLWMAGIILTISLFFVGLFWGTDTPDTTSGVMIAVVPFVFIIISHILCLAFLALSLGAISRAAELTMTAPRGR